jgi:hypothetical protein
MFALLVSGVRKVGDASAAPNAEMDDIDNAAETAAPDIKTSRRVTNADAGLLMCASSDQVGVHRGLSIAAIRVDASILGAYTV